VSERFDAEGLLREVLEVLRRHNIPVETVSLNVSLLDAAFDELIPQLKTYKAGAFNRPLVINDVPMFFLAQRRYPFDEIVGVLEREIRPQVEAFAESIRREYPDLKVQFDSVSATKVSGWPHSLYWRSYRLGILCQFSNDAHADYNQLDLSIWLQQDSATAYPRLHASVGWLVDEETGDDWGLDMVCDALGPVGDYAPYHLNLLKQGLPRCFERYGKEIERKRTGDLAIPG
jgi:hypothetical protein